MIQDFEAFRKKAGIRVFNSPGKIRVEDDTSDFNLWQEKWTLSKCIHRSLDTIIHIKPFCDSGNFQRSIDMVRRLYELEQSPLTIQGYGIFK